MPRRPPRPATAAYLERVALYYLERHAGSEAQLRRVLGTRVRRSVEELGTDRAEGEAAIEEVVEKLRRLGYVDDARYAQGRVRSMRQRGRSARAIRAALAQRGVAGALVDEALEEGPDELAAARDFARRRRIGPHRPEALRAENRERDLAKMARAGFGYDVARRVLEGDREED